MNDIVVPDNLFCAAWLMRCHMLNVGLCVVINQNGIEWEQDYNKGHRREHLSEMFLDAATQHSTVWHTITRAPWIQLDTMQSSLIYQTSGIQFTAVLDRSWSICFFKLQN